MNVSLVSESSQVASDGTAACVDAIQAAGAVGTPIDVTPKRVALALAPGFGRRLAAILQRNQCVTIIKADDAFFSPDDLLVELEEVFGSVAEAAKAVSSGDVRLSCDEEVPYFAPASLSSPLSVAAATEQSSRLETANRLCEVLGQDAVNGAVASPFSGSLSGCAVVLIALGAVPMDASLAHFDSQALVQRLPTSDVLVVVTDLLDWRQLRNSLVTSCADYAAEHLVPCVVLTGSLDVGQRELSAIGVAGAYGCLDEPLTSDGELRRLPTADEWSKAATKLARVWVRRL